MSELHPPLSPLEPQTDRPSVELWLRDYLASHIRWWADAYGLGWDDARVAGHLEQHHEALVTRDWRSLVTASESDTGMVGVVRSDSGAPLGVVQAGADPERFMCMPFGSLDWIYVAPRARGKGLAGMMLQAARAWMMSRGLPGAAVFVTAANPGAVRLYERNGFAIVDHRMLAPLPTG